MRVLSIGNSFSQDAQRYLSRIARNEGEDFSCTNLYIGGCSLRTHHVNYLNEGPYSLEYNGEFTGAYTSIRLALSRNEWDYVTIQQASHFSPYWNTYEPHLSVIADAVRLYAPKAKLLIHQTWAYADGSQRLTEELGYNNHYEMLAPIVECYKKAAEVVGADGIIPCGEVMMRAQELGLPEVHRDTFHATLGAGRYMLGLMWYRCLTGKYAEKDIQGFDVDVTPEEIAIVRQAVKDVMAKYE